ncbi:hypothetical protein K501DRAFT_239766 [Backusella circina FSU 941]|nr:hypothetical protein K501DRAFT_239766 [Backusella circina FSU 941]
MDLSWCIVCDNHIDEENDSSKLYCSEACEDLDQLKSIVSSNVTKKPLKQSTMIKMKRSNGYPWIPLYRRHRRGMFVSKRYRTTSSITMNKFLVS